MRENTQEEILVTCDNIFNILMGRFVSCLRRSPFIFVPSREIGNMIKRQLPNYTRINDGEFMKLGYANLITIIDADSITCNEEIFVQLNKGTKLISEGYALNLTGVFEKTMKEYIKYFLGIHPNIKLGLKKVFFRYLNKEVLCWVFYLPRRYQDSTGIDFYKIMDNRKDIDEAQKEWQKIK